MHYCDYLINSFNDYLLNKFKYYYYLLIDSIITKANEFNSIYIGRCTLQNCSLFQSLLTAGTSFFRITNNIQIEGIQEKSIETYLQVLHIFMIDLKGIWTSVYSHKWDRMHSSQVHDTTRDYYLFLRSVEKYKQFTFITKV